MNREYHRWYSPSLHRDMELLVFGSSGTPVIVFPTSLGRFYEYEDRGMVSTLAGKIEAGWLHLYCVDSVDAESWYNRDVDPYTRVMRHFQYERYLLDEVIPLIHTRGAEPDGRAIATGCSLGAFHAALLTFRHPSTVLKLVALSGKYENSAFMNGHTGEEAYLTNPLAFLPNLHDDGVLQALRACEIDIVTGATDPHVHEARELSSHLWAKDVPNTLDVWDGWVHDWPYWQEMIVKYL